MYALFQMKNQVFIGYSMIGGDASQHFDAPRGVFSP